MNTISESQSRVMVLARFIDVVLVMLGMWLAVKLYGVQWSDTQVSLILLIPTPFFLFIGNINRLYNSWRAANIKEELSKVIWTWVITWITTMGLIIFLKLFRFLPRLIIVGWFIIPLFLLLAWHITFRKLLRSARGTGWNFKDVAIIGAGYLGCELAQKINNAPWMGFRLVGFFDDFIEPGVKPELSDCDIPVVGKPEELLKPGYRNKVERIYITLPLKAEARIKTLITEFSETTCAVYWVPNYFTFDLLHSRLADVDGLTTISIYESPFYGIDSWVKQAEDLFLGSIIFLLILIPMIVIGFLIKLTSRGPVFFKQKRYGFNGKEIIVWKFRTMRVEKPDTSKKYHQATKNDPRVTPVGRILRKTSLDELPQFINVLQGRMSIVGPRPHPILLDEQFRKRIYGYMLRHKVKPGITGWAQVNGWRGETDTIEKMEKRIEHDIFYIKNWSLTFDLKIVLLTFFKGFTGDNAY